MVDVGVALYTMCLCFLSSLPLLLMTFIASAFNDTSARMETVLTSGFMLILVVPLIILQIVFNFTNVKRLVKYRVNKCLVAIFSITQVLLAYGMLSLSYAPESLFVRVLNTIFK